MLSVEEKYKYTTAEESVIYKDWAAGSRHQIDSQEFLIKKIGQVYIAEIATIRYAPAWWKIIDELIVNALDHIVRTQKVTTLRIQFERSGRVKVYNDGPGIEVEIHKVASEAKGKPVYVPTFIFGELYQGSNRERAADCIIGGTNGLGAKLGSCFGLEFAVETVSNKYFMQKWKNHKSIEEPPIIREISDPLLRGRNEPHTLVSMMPDYELFGYESALDDITYNNLCALLRTRAFFAAAYASHASKSVQVYFNDDLVPIKSMQDVAKLLFPGAQIISTRIQPTVKIGSPYKYPWEVCAVIAPNELKPASNVNGVMVRAGKHFVKISNLIVAGVTECIAKSLKDKDMNFAPSYVTSNMYLMLNTQIPNPSWTGQRKDEVDLDMRNLGGYSLPDQFVKQLAGGLQSAILNNIFTKESAKQTKTKKISYEKYTGAKYAGTKQSSKCSLMLTEGDSAKNRMQSGVNEGPGTDYIGLMSTGGVIINPRKLVTVVPTASGPQYKWTDKLKKNAFMCGLLEVVGLNPFFKYDPSSSTYAQEMKKLRYGHVIACVDQDLDGKGCILGFIINIFALFWPKLLAAGFVQWFDSPIVRAYAKTKNIIPKMIPFYSIPEYRVWAQLNVADSYLHHYYKGLGSHSREEVVHMCKDFYSKLHTFGTDERTAELFEIYLGKEPNLRKAKLSQPPRQFTDAELLAQQKSKYISCSDQLEKEIDEYQRDNLDRKLDHIIDGQNQAGRKILDGIIKKLRGAKMPIRVDQLGGYIAENENYQHGGASLNSSITGRGLICAGGKQLPLIVPFGNFGDRREGGGNAAGDRYIHALLNPITEVIFPAIDYHILEFHFDEGTRSEPKFFVPIIPMCICESTELPAHGWKLKIWARDVFKVIENVRRLIRIDDNAKLMRMPPTRYSGTTHKWTGEFKNIRGEPYSFGRYEFIDAQTVRITELPLRVWTVPYVNDLRKKEDKGLITPYDSGQDIGVDITVKFAPGVLNTLSGDSCFTDRIEEFLQLRDHMDSHINFMSTDGSIKSFTDYESPMYVWFEMRKKYYTLRIERQIILMSLEIVYLENVVRYIKAKLTLGSKKRAEMISVLQNDNYDMIALGKLTTPKFTPTCELESVILRGKKASYAYLLNLSVWKMSEESLIKWDQRLADARTKLNDYKDFAAQGRFQGAAIWEAELDVLEQKITEGLQTNWLFEDADKYDLSNC